ncbi:hypothetical protein DUI70_6537 [Streptomyces albus]|nr:hypothetical protein DUI70_6537 [Streptomyces albus]
MGLRPSSRAACRAGSGWSVRAGAQASWRTAVVRDVMAVLPRARWSLSEEP